MTIDGPHRPDVVPITPGDDKFHPYTSHPDETETFWVSFHDADRKLGGWLYNQVLFNQGICNGGAWVWDASQARALYEVNHRGLPLEDPERMDLRNIALPNGNRLEMLEPLTKYRCRRSDPGKFECDLIFEGVQPPHSHPIGVPPFWKGRHFDQCMHVTGQIEINGETIDIGSLSVRDRSWGPRPRPRPPGRASSAKKRIEPDAVTRRRPPYTPFGIGYLFGSQSGDDMFLAYTLPCIYDDQARDYVTTGYLLRDGTYGLLLDGNRRCEFDPDRGWMRTIWLEAVDEHGRELNAVGKLVSHHGESGQGTGYFQWEWDKGCSGYGEDQSAARGDLLQALNEAGLWKLEP